MNVRQYILETIEKVLFHHGFASLILRSAKNYFSKQDMGLISEIVYGTIRNYSFLTMQWQPFVQHKVRNRTAVILSMSVYQLFYLDKVPPYAIINEAVGITELRDKKFVNAILRAVIKKGIQMPTTDDTLEYIAQTTSHPLWIMRLWKSHYGFDIAVQIAKCNQRNATVYGRINTLKIEKKELEQNDEIHFIDEEVFTYDGVLSKTKWFKEGFIVIQDLSSCQIAHFLNVEEGMQVLDVCAAPGTKTQQIAMYMKNKGKIIALDLYRHRLELLEELMLRTGVDICQSFTHDATLASKEFHESSFDRILIDAPCSGLGDLAHKPEIRYHLTAENIDSLIQIQKNILEINAKYLKPNGILVYSTCTLNKKENEQQISSFLKCHKEFRLLQEKTFFPFEHNSDGFYVAQLQKIDCRV